MEMRRFFERFEDINPRIVYLLMALALVLPVIKPIGMPIVIDKNMTKPVFDWIENCEPGEIVFFDAAYGGGSDAELSPQLEAWFYHCLKKDLKVIGIAQWNTGAMIAGDLCKKVAEQAKADGYNAEYGVDWVFVGWKSMIWRELREDFWKTCGNTDFWGNHFDTLPLMEKVRKWNVETSRSFIVFVAGSPGVGTYLVNWADHDIYVGVAAVEVSGHMSVLRSGQIKGLLAGMGGGAQYEKLLGREGDACALMDAQSLGHLIILALIILGNVSYLLKRRNMGSSIN